MKVHNYLRNEFQKVIYQRCLTIEFKKAGLQFGKEIEQILYYHKENIGTRCVNFIVENCVMVEIKA